MGTAFVIAGVVAIVSAIATVCFAWNWIQDELWFGESDDEDETRENKNDKGPFHE